MLYHRRTCLVHDGVSMPREPVPHDVRSVNFTDRGLLLHISNQVSCAFQAKQCNMHRPRAQHNIAQNASPILKHQQPATCSCRRVTEAWRGLGLGLGGSSPGSGGFWGVLGVGLGGFRSRV